MISNNIKNKYIKVYIYGNVFTINLLAYLHLFLYKTSRGEYNKYIQFKRLSRKQKREKLLLFLKQYRKHKNILYKAKDIYGHGNDDIVWLYGEDAQKVVENANKSTEVKIFKPNENYWKTVKKTRKQINKLKK